MKKIDEKQGRIAREEVGDAKEPSGGLAKPSVFHALNVCNVQFSVAVYHNLVYTHIAAGM